MKKLLLILLFPVFGFTQSYSFTSADISGALTAASLEVDNVALDNATIGHSSDIDLLTVASGSLTLAGDLVTSSDENLKSNIASLGPVLIKLISLSPKRYTMKNDTEQKEKIGLLAQEVQAVFPELVDENGEYMSVNYQALIPILISAVNEQTKKNESLKQRIETLKSKVN
ncbi:tail fiber domain-containing protein [Flavobacteriaceae bacterium]|nr:tail fiber domain-containing protein [Flavobacteriaceae bacterium]